MEHRRAEAEPRPVPDRHIRHGAADDPPGAGSRPFLRFKSGPDPISRVAKDCLQGRFA